MKQKISLTHKMREVISDCSLQTQRFGLLVWTLATSENKPDDMDEFLRIILDLSQAQLDASRAEFNEALEAWNKTNGEVNKRFP